MYFKSSAAVVVAVILDAPLEPINEEPLVDNSDKNSGGGFDVVPVVALAAGVILVAALSCLAGKAHQRKKRNRRLRGEQTGAGSFAAAATGSVVMSMQDMASIASIESMASVGSMYSTESMY